MKMFVFRKALESAMLFAITMSDITPNVTSATTKGVGAICTHMWAYHPVQHGPMGHLELTSSEMMTLDLFYTIHLSSMH